MIKKIGHYSLTNPASVYDEEALTALELTGRTAQKVNECIDQVNENSDEVALIPSKVQTATETLVEAYIEDGTFDEAIDEYAGHLTQRVDNLVKNTVVGGTTMDAEVIDARVGVEGTTHPNLGTAVRKEIGYRTNIGYIGFDDRPAIQFFGGNVTITTTGNARIYNNGTCVNVPLNINATANTDSRYKILFGTESLTFRLVSWSERTPYQYEIMVGFIAYGEVFWNELDHNKKYLGIDSRRPMHPFVWTDTQPTLNVEDSPVDSSFYQFTLTMPALYIDDPFKSYNINGKTVTIQAKKASLYRLVYNLGERDYDIVYHGDEVKQNDLVVGYVSPSRGVYLNGCHHHMENDVESFPPIILGWESNYIAFNSADKTFTIPRDTMILANTRKGYNQVYYLAPTDEPVTVSFSECATSAIKVYYTPSTDTTYCVDYNVKNTYDGDLLIASFRTTGAVSINAPYSWNGKPYNIDIPETTSSSSSAMTYNPNLKIICHRGYTQDGKTENTLGAFRRAWEKGYKYVECDVRYTSDRVPVLLHDETVDRTSNGTGAIANMTINEVEALDFGGEKIPRFEEFIRLCKMLGLHAYVELKEDIGEATIDHVQEDLLHIVYKYGMEDHVTWISFYNNSLRGMLYNYICHEGFEKGSNACHIRMLYITSESTLSEVKSIINEWYDVIGSDFNLNSYSNKYIIEFGVDTVPAKLMEYRISVNYQNHFHVEMWTVNDDATMKEVAPYVHGITTDSLPAGGVIDEWS